MSKFAHTPPAETSTTMPFVASIEIDTDDDFHVNIEGKLIQGVGAVSIQAPSEQAALSAAMAAIEQAALPWAKSWAVQDSRGSRAGSYAQHWVQVTELLRQAVAENPLALHWKVGGNQQITLKVSQAKKRAPARESSQKAFPPPNHPRTKDRGSTR